MQHPNDIEIVAQPIVFGPNSSFGARNLLDKACEDALAESTLEKRPDRNGRFAWGEKSKRGIFYHEGQYAAVDLFSLTEPAQWGVIYAIRIGPGLFNRYLVTSQWFRGACPKNRKVAGGRVWSLPPDLDTQEALAAMPSNKFLRVSKSIQEAKMTPTPSRAGLLPGAARSLAAARRADRDVVGPLASQRKSLGYAQAPLW